MRRLAAILCGIAMGIGLSSPALAHVTVQPTEAPTGSFFRFVVRVPNERPDAATTKVEVKFPANLVFVSFQPKEGWTRSVRMKTLDKPIETFGEEIDEVVGSVTWTGGKIEPNEFDEFGFSAKVPDNETTLSFPALQTYDSGEVVRWTGPADAETPAAQVNVIDLGAGESEGPLAITAELKDEVGKLNSQAPANPDSGSSSSESNTGILLGSGGLLLGGLALILTLVRRRG